MSEQERRPTKPTVTEHQSSPAHDDVAASDRRRSATNAHHDIRRTAGHEHGLARVRHAVELGLGEDAVAQLVAGYPAERHEILEYLGQAKGPSFVIGVVAKIDHANAEAHHVAGEVRLLAGQLEATARDEWHAAVDALDESRMSEAAARALEGWNELVTSRHRLDRAAVDARVLADIDARIATTRQRLGGVLGAKHFRGTAIGGALHRGEDPNRFVHRELSRALHVVHVANGILAICGGGGPTANDFVAITTLTQRLDVDQMRFLLCVMRAHSQDRVVQVLELGQLQALRERGDLAEITEDASLVNRALDDVDRLRADIRAVRATRDSSKLWAILARYDTPEEKDVLLAALNRHDLIDSVISRGGATRVLAWMASSKSFRTYRYDESRDHSAPSVGQFAKEAGELVPAALAYEGAGALHGLGALDPTGILERQANAVDKLGDHWMESHGIHGKELGVARGIGHLVGELEVVLATMGYAEEAKAAAVAQQVSVAMLEAQQALAAGARYVELALTVGPDLVRVVEAAATGNPAQAHAAIDHGLDSLIESVMERVAGGAAEEAEAHEEREQAIHRLKGDVDAEMDHRIAQWQEQGTQKHGRAGGAVKSAGAALLARIKEAVVAAVVAGLQVIKKRLLAGWDAAARAATMREMMVDVCGEAAGACAEPLAGLADDAVTAILMRAIQAALKKEGVDIAEMPGADGLIRPQVAKLASSIVGGVDGITHFKRHIEKRFRVWGRQLGELAFSPAEKAAEPATPEGERGAIDRALDWVDGEPATDWMTPEEAKAKEPAP
jgi:hypothetical protein